jgi:hypothetical protein
MRTIALSSALFSVSCGALLFAAPAFAQSTSPAAPIPPALTSARTIFLSNAGADAGLFPEPFSGDPTRGYNEMYADLKQSGKYQLVGDPSQADLVLELRLQAPMGPADPNKVKGASDPLPQFRLTIYDARSHYILWTLSQSIEIAYLQKTHDRNFDLALSGLATQFEQLTGKTTP